MCLFEFDQEKYERTIRNEGLQQGLKQGLQQLIIALYSLGISKEVICNKLQTQYNLSEKEANEAIDKYSPTIN